MEGGVQAEPGPVTPAPPAADPADPADRADRADPAGRPSAGPSGRAAVLGSPIRHSLSPALHRAAYGALGLDWDYQAYEVGEAALPAFLAGLEDQDAPWAGLSLTMPLKRAVLPLLDEVSPLAEAVEAANTVVFDRPDPGQGGGAGAGARRRGENTDVPGMVAALRERGVDRVGAAAVLGGGATASSAVAALREVCAGEITVYARGPGRAAELRADGGAARTPGTGRAVGPRGAGAAGRVGRRHHARRGGRRAGRRGCGERRRGTVRRGVRPVADPAGRGLGGGGWARWCPGSTCWCTRPCSRWS